MYCPNFFPGLRHYEGPLLTPGRERGETTPVDLSITKNPGDPSDLPTSADHENFRLLMEQGKLAVAAAAAAGLTVSTAEAFGRQIPLIDPSLLYGRLGPSPFRTGGHPPPPPSLSGSTGPGSGLLESVGGGPPGSSAYCGPPGTNPASWPTSVHHPHFNLLSTGLLSQGQVAPPPPPGLDVVSQGPPSFMDPNGIPYHLRLSTGLTAPNQRNLFTAGRPLTTGSHHHPHHPHSHHLPSHHFGPAAFSAGLSPHFTLYSDLLTDLNRRPVGNPTSGDHHPEKVDAFSGLRANSEPGTRFSDHLQRLREQQQHQQQQQQQNHHHSQQQQQSKCSGPCCIPSPMAPPGLGGDPGCSCCTKALACVGGVPPPPPPPKLHPSTMLQINVSEPGSIGVNNMNRSTSGCKDRCSHELHHGSGSSSGGGGGGNGGGLCSNNNNNNNDCGLSNFHATKEGLIGSSSVSHPQMENPLKVGNSIPHLWNPTVSLPQPIHIPQAKSVHHHQLQQQQQQPGSNLVKVVAEAKGEPTSNNAIVSNQSGKSGKNGASKPTEKGNDLVTKLNETLPFKSNTNPTIINGSGSSSTTTTANNNGTSNSSLCKVKLESTGNAINEAIGASNVSENSCEVITIEEDSSSKLKSEPHSAPSTPLTVPPPTLIPFPSFGSTANNNTNTNVGVNGLSPVTGSQDEFITVNSGNSLASDQRPISPSSVSSSLLLLSSRTTLEESSAARKTENSSHIKQDPSSGEGGLSSLDGSSGTSGVSGSCCNVTNGASSSSSGTEMKSKGKRVDESNQEEFGRGGGGEGEEEEMSPTIKSIKNVNKLGKDVSDMDLGKGSKQTTSCATSLTKQLKEYKIHSKGHKSSCGSSITTGSGAPGGSGGGNGTASASAFAGGSGGGSSSSYGGPPAKKIKETKTIEIQCDGPDWTPIVLPTQFRNRLLKSLNRRSVDQRSRRESKEKEGRKKRSKKERDSSRKGDHHHHHHHHGHETSLSPSSSSFGSPQSSSSKSQDSLQHQHHHHHHHHHHHSPCLKSGSVGSVVVGGSSSSISGISSSVSSAHFGDQHEHHHHNNNQGSEGSKSSSHRKRSMLDCLTNSDGYVGDKVKKRCTDPNLFASDPSVLDREERAIQDQNNNSCSSSGGGKGSKAGSQSNNRIPTTANSSNGSGSGLKSVTRMASAFSSFSTSRSSLKKQHPEEPPLPPLQEKHQHHQHHHHHQKDYCKEDEDGNLKNIGSSTTNGSCSTKSKSKSKTCTKSQSKSNFVGSTGAINAIGSTSFPSSPSSSSAVETTSTTTTITNAIATSLCQTGLGGSGGGKHKPSKSSVGKKDSKKGSGIIKSKDVSSALGLSSSKEKKKKPSSNGGGGGCGGSGAKGKRKLRERLLQEKLQVEPEEEGDFDSSGKVDSGHEEDEKDEEETGLDENFGHIEESDPLPLSKKRTNVNSDSCGGNRNVNGSSSAPTGANKKKTPKTKTSTTTKQKQTGGSGRGQQGQEEVVAAAAVVTSKVPNNGLPVQGTQPKKPVSSVRRRRFRSGLDMIRNPKRKKAKANHANSNSNNNNRTTPTGIGSGGARDESGLSRLSNSSVKGSDESHKSVYELEKNSGAATPTRTSGTTVQNSGGGGGVASANSSVSSYSLGGVGGGGGGGPPPEMKRIMVNKALGETILHRAARQGYKDVVIYCLETNACDINTRDNAGYTPLHECCSRGHLPIARAFLEYGADVNASAAGGIRPLHDAVEGDHLEVVRLLLSYGADPSISTYSGLTPLKLAHSKSMVEFLKGFLDDITDDGMDPKAKKKEPVLSWKFRSSLHSSDPNSIGFDIFEDLPSDLDADEEDSDDFLFEISDTPLLPTFRLLLPDSSSKAYSNCIRLSETLKQTGLTKDEFKSRHKHITVYSLSKQEYESQVSGSHFYLDPKYGAKYGNSDLNCESQLIDVVILNDDLRSILEIETMRLR